MIIPIETIEQAKQALGEQNAPLIAEILSLEQYDEANHKALCKFHDEHTPSFIYNPKEFNYHCFGCGRNVDILDAYMHSGKTYIQAVQALFKRAGIQYAFGEVGVKTHHQYAYPVPVYADNCEQAYAYLAQRGISAATAEYLGLRQDKQGNILIQYYDTNDVLCVCKVRPSRRVDKGKPKIWYLKDEKGQPYDNMPLLYNMNKVNASAPLLITCGEFDCAAAIEAGWINAVSIPGGDSNTQWVSHCWEWLEQFSEIIICPDNDASGEKFGKEIVSRLGSWRCKIAEVPEFLESDGRTYSINDLNEALVRLGKEAVLKVILAAKDSPIQSVRDLSDIEDVDLDQMDGLNIGIDGLDRELMRLFYGTLTIFSGMPGSGKTSFLYQIICQALHDGLNCWLYSKELPDWMSKNWLNFILAGRHNIKEYKTWNESSYYKVTPDAKLAIDDYYRGRWFIYRDDLSSDLDDLIASMTDVVRKYGCKLLLLDNLMTINIGAQENNELLKQTETINRLIHFATKYDVAVILVCHPRKLMNTSEVGMYDISGTANIANLAHRTISLRRVTPKEKEGEPNFNGKGYKVKPCKYDVLCTVIKDRIRGRASYQCGMYYDGPTRRFFTNEGEFHHQYSWDKTRYEEKPPYPIKDDESEVFG